MILSERHSMLSTVAHGALLGLAFGYFEQGMPDSRERHMFKYAVFGALGFAVIASIRRAEQMNRNTMECLVLE